VRLTKLKLSGFKSFVEPTTVLFPGQLAGVVGPNGCGKSNIIDAVRWVLGESKASELRGESIQDVIFKGSGNRKEVSRASVELFFDNAEGRAAGQWSQYAEITVKRVLDREGNSSYYINNLHVRRRDVIDLFLGTGLGPRAYAIIGQGMISRIVEAKPEELRFFLEEAAGVTKYKERRRETEHRLEDARENIARVDDIRNELENQVVHLQAQATVAQQYRGLHEEMSRKQSLLWLKKRNDARNDGQRLTRQIEESVTRVEAETAQLREIEARVEHARENHYAASDALHAAQAEMYAAGSEVSRLESELGPFARFAQPPGNAPDPAGRPSMRIGWRSKPRWPTTPHAGTPCWKIPAPELPPPLRGTTKRQRVCRNAKTRCKARALKLPRPVAP
jgi:chromosome segregation protein